MEHFAFPVLEAEGGHNLVPPDFAHHRWDLLEEVPTLTLQMGQMSVPEYYFSQNGDPEGASQDSSMGNSNSLSDVALLGVPQRKSLHPVLSSYPVEALLQKTHFCLLELILCSVYLGHWKLGDYLSYTRRQILSHILHF